VDAPVHDNVVTRSRLAASGRDAHAHEREARCDWQRQLEVESALDWPCWRRLAKFSSFRRSVVLGAHACHFSLRACFFLAFVAVVVWVVSPAAAPAAPSSLSCTASETSSAATGVCNLARRRVSKGITQQLHHSFPGMRCPRTHLRPLFGRDSSLRWRLRARNGRL